MPQYQPDLRERGALAQHPGCETVAEQVRPFESGRQSGPRQRALHDRANGARMGEASPWRFHTEKHSPRGVRLAIPTDIGGERFADFGQQGELVLRQTFAAAHEDLPGTPPDVVEF
jgi:hypothetical protein